MNRMTGDERNVIAMYLSAYHFDGEPEVLLDVHDRPVARS